MAGTIKVKTTVFGVKRLPGYGAEHALSVTTRLRTHAVSATGGFPAGAAL